MLETSDDAFLGGKLMLRQPSRGHRAGHDAMLLAASVSAKRSDTVIDLGAGVGAAGLAVAKRVGGLDLALVEIDPALAAIARFNAEANGITARVIAGNVADAELPQAAHVMMNPPFHDDARHRPSPDASRRVAHMAADDTLETWIDAAHRLLKPRGVLTLIWRADGLADVLKCVGNKLGSLEVLPVHGARNKPAIRILLRAVKNGRAPLVVHTAAMIDGSDDKVEAALRGEGTLALVAT